MRFKPIKTLHPVGLGATTEKPLNGVKRAYRTHAARLDGEPWRTAYGTSAYRHDRAAALDRYAGRCGSCAATIAYKTAAGVWTMKPGAGVHHTTRLADGGQSAALVPLCGKCHAAADAAERRKAKAAGHGRTMADRAALAWDALHHGGQKSHE